MQFLEFERPIAKIEEKIKTLSASNDNNQDVQKNIQTLKLELANLTKKIYGSLTNWQIIQIARHPDRPHFIDLVNKVFTDFQELHGDRLFGDDRAIIGGLAYLGRQPVMVIGQEKGRNTQDKLKHNFGMMHPEGYRKALRLVKLAEKFDIPVITFIDTPGAYPGIEAEGRGQSSAIAHNLLELSRLQVPIVCVIIGEGCSGGALGIGVGDRLIMLEYSYFATISPEGCATILWKTSSKAPSASEAMGITSKTLKKINIVDEVITEPLGGAHRDIVKISGDIKTVLKRSVSELLKFSKNERYEKRYKRLMSFGNFDID